MSLNEQLHILLKESRRRSGTIATTILVVSLVVLALGLLWSEQYESSATILVDNDKIIGPLLEGTTVPTSARDQADLAKEVVFSRDVLEEVIKQTGWTEPDATLLEREEVMELLRKKVKVVNVGDNLIEIKLKDSSPQRAFRTVTLLSDMFIERTRNAKYAESQQAYRFISNEAERYRKKLQESESRLQDFLAENGNVGPGSSEMVNNRVSELMRDIQTTSLDLEEAKVRARSLGSQLSDESATTASITREEQVRSMIADLQSQLEELRLRYHDTYPDIISTKHKIEALREQLEQEQQRRENGSSDSAYADAVALNPLHEELRAELSKARTQVAALEKRLERNQEWLSEVEGKGVEISGVEAQASQLTREYQVTKQIYENLLERREAARIAMNMDEGGEGLTMSIQEPATVPLQPSGIRFMHFAILAPIFGALLAFGGVYARTRLDDRVRSPSTISRELQIPVLATVPVLAVGPVISRQRRVRFTVVTAALLLVAAYLFVALLKMNGFV